MATAVPRSAGQCAAKRREFVQASNLKPGDQVELDGGFTCREAGVVTIHRDKRFEGLAGLYFTCNDGRHYLDGQLDEDGSLAGVYPVRAE